MRVQVKVSSVARMSPESVQGTYQDCLYEYVWRGVSINVYFFGMILDK